MKNLPLLRGPIISIIEGLLLSVTFSSAIRAQSSSAPVYEITPEVSKISFAVKASISLEGTFEKWDASLKFTSTDSSTGGFDVKIEADSVNTGSGFKDDKLKGKDFFDVKKDPYITFHSTKIVQMAPSTFQVQGTFTIRGVSKPETLNFVADREGKATGPGQRNDGIRPEAIWDRQPYPFHKNC